MSSDHDVLGVPTDADLATVKAAYRRRARACHPDRGGDTVEFQRVREAYGRLVAGQPAPEDRPPPYPDPPPDRPTRDVPDEPGWGSDATAEPGWGTDVPTRTDEPGWSADDLPAPGPLGERHPLPRFEPEPPLRLPRAGRAETVLRSVGIVLVGALAVLTWFSGARGSTWWYVVAVACALPGRFWAALRWGVLVTLAALTILVSAGSVVVVLRDPGRPAWEALAGLSVVVAFGVLVVGSWMARRRHQRFPTALRDHQAHEASRAARRQQAERWDRLDHLLATDPGVSLWFVVATRPTRGGATALLNRTLPDGSHQRCTRDLWGSTVPDTWIVADLAAGQVVASAHEADRLAWNAVHGWT